MGRKSKLELQEPEFSNKTKPTAHTCNDLACLDENKEITNEKRTQAREKLKALCGTNQNIDDILASLERYCELILQSP